MPCIAGDGRRGVDQVGPVCRGAPWSLIAPMISLHSLDKSLVSFYHDYNLRCRALLATHVTVFSPIDKAGNFLITPQQPDGSWGHVVIEKEPLIDWGYG
jgi:hypothetical protein